MVCLSKLKQAKALHYFGTMVETGSHERSLQLVLARKELTRQLRVVAMLGPSSIPLIVVAKSLDSHLKCCIQEVLLKMHDDPDAADGLHAGRIDHFVAVTDTDYDDIRKIFAHVQAAMKASSLSKSQP